MKKRADKEIGTEGARMISELLKSNQSLIELDLLREGENIMNEK